MVIATVFDGVKTLVMIIGVLAILRIFKTAFATKHAKESIQAFDKKKREAEALKEQAKRNEGRISIQHKASPNSAAQDVDFEEIKE